MFWQLFGSHPETCVAHQIRVHLQYLGHAISNDPVYSEHKIWVGANLKLFACENSSVMQGPTVGKGGIDSSPCNEREAPLPPSHLQADVEDHGNPESINTPINSTTAAASAPKRFPRETGEDIGMGSPVPLSKEAVGIITRLRSMKVSSSFVDI